MKALREKKVRTGRNAGTGGDDVTAPTSEKGVAEEGTISNLVHDNGHILLRSLDVEDWQRALHDDREARLASLGDVTEG